MLTETNQSRKQGLSIMFSRFSFLLTVSALLLTCSHVLSQVSKQADILLLNGKIWTGETPDKFEEALAIKGNRIAAVGKTSELQKMADANTKIIDLKGQLVTAGFNDAHTHFLSGSMGLANVDLNNATSEEEAIHAIAEYAKQHPEKKWIIGRGWQYGIFKNAMPNKELLDKTIPDRPVFMSAYDGHSGWVNSKALELAGINGKTDYSGFGAIIKNENGEPTGALTEGAQQLVRKWIPAPSNEEQLAALKIGMQYAASLGITSIQNASGTIPEFALYESLLQSNALTLRSSTAFSVGKNTTEAEIKSFAVLKEKYKGHPMLRASSIKFMVDGVIESHTAAMIDPYADTNITGELALPEKLYKSLVQLCDAEGFQLYTHAIGDRGVRVALDAYEDAMRKNGQRGKRHRVEHIEQSQPTDVKRFAKLGVIASMEPIHADPGTVAVWEKAVGKKRLPHSFVWRSMLDNNVQLVFSSDWPACITPDPIRGLHTAVNRKTTDGKPEAGWVPEQRITMAEALKAYTQGGAYSSGDEQVLGKLLPGFFADIIVHTKDLFAIPAAQVYTSKVALTIANGQVVYQLPQPDEMIKE